MSEFRPRCVVVTGGAGFIGSNLIRWLLAHDPNLAVVNVDVLTYAGNLESLNDVSLAHGTGGDGRYYFHRADICDFDAMAALLGGRANETATYPQPRRIPRPDAVIHLAAETHVDRSIMGPAAFVRTNVTGTLTLLESCRAEISAEPRDFRFLNVGTDEVYGTLTPSDPPFTENTPLAPNSPYSASKAGADLLVRAYVETFRFPAVLTRCSNNYGPYQFPEKLIPLMITRALADEPLPVYGDGLNVRDWLHVDDHASALWEMLTRGRLGEVYNIGGESEEQNLEVVRAILRHLGKPDRLIRFVTDRPGHDRRYAMNINKLRTELGWQPQQRFAQGLEQTVAWYVANASWWQRVSSEAYRATNALYLQSD